MAAPWRAQTVKSRCRGVDDAPGPRASWETREYREQSGSGRAGGRPEPLLTGAHPGSLMNE